MLIDPYQRQIDYIRLSVTDRCDFRCGYCMSEHMRFLPKAEVLSLEEMYRLAQAFWELGVRRIRLTGGEPLVRRGIVSLIESLGAHVGTELTELTLTTNASQLPRFAERIAGAGVRRVNISLDTLRADRFAEITRWGRFRDVMAGIDAAVAAGLRVKINAVALKGVNSDEVHDLVSWCGQRGFDLTFIEVMPMGDIGSTHRLDQYWPLSLLRRELAQRWTLHDSDERSAGPARYVRVAETGGKIGFITPLTHNFCEACNRVRITCTGVMYMCLGQQDQIDLRAPLRRSAGLEDVKRAIIAGIARKPKGHDFVMSRRRAPVAVSRHMSVTGG